MWDTSDQGTGNTTDWASELNLGTPSVGSVNGLITGLSGDTSYTWRMYGETASSANGWTVASTFSTNLTVAQVPVFTDANVITDSLNLDLYWQDNAQTETAYILSRSSDGVNFSTLATLSADTTTYSDNVFSPGGYTYRLSVQNSVNGSSTDAALCEIAVTVPSPVLYLDPILRISNNSNFQISVFPGKAAYDGDVSGVFGDGTVMAYKFYQNGVSPNLVNYAADGSDRISDISNQTFATFADFDRGDVWTVTDPGTLDGSSIPDFSTGADYGGATATISGAYNVAGNVDVSNLVSGTVYLLLGGYDTPFDVDVSLTGVGQTDKLADVDVDPPTTRNIYIVKCNISNPSRLYQRMNFTYTGSATNRSRFMGVIVDGVAPAYGTIIRIE